MARRESSTTQTHHRSSETGQFVTRKYAETHPRTTEREQIRHPAPSPSPGSGRKK